MRASIWTFVVLPATAMSLTAQRPSQGDTARYSANKLFVEISGGANWMSADTVRASTKPGGGLTVGIGYGFPTRVALGSWFTYSVHGDAGYAVVLAQADFVARYHFSRADSRFVPFVDAGLSFQEAAAMEDEVGDGRQEVVEVFNHSGAGYSVATGFHVFLTPMVALTTTLRFTRTRFTEISVRDATIPDFEYRASTTRLSVGVTGFPGIPRK